MPKSKILPIAKPRLKKDDEVIVIAGRDKGKTGNIVRVLRPKQRVFVSGINMVYKHVKPDPQRGEKGKIVQREASIHISNVAIYNPNSKKPDRVGYRFVEEGNKKNKIRVYRSSGEVIDKIA